MSDLKENWEKVGKGLGSSFSNLGKAVIKTTKDGVDNVSDWACGEETKGTTVDKEEWASVGKGLGAAFRDLGKAVVKSAKVGADKVTEWAMEDDADSADKK